MNNQEWGEVAREVTKVLDSIDLLQEMKFGRESLDDFMDRLETKYTFEFKSATSLFDAYNTEDFKDYLYNRYNNDFHLQEIIHTDIIKR